MKRMILLLAVVIMTAGCSLFDNSVNKYEDHDTGPTITVVLNNNVDGYTKAGFFYLGSIDNFNDSFYLYKEVPIENNKFTFNLPANKPRFPYMYFAYGSSTDSIMTVVAYYSINLYYDNCVDTVQAVGNENEIYYRYKLKGQLEGVNYGPTSQSIQCDTLDSDWYLTLPEVHVDYDTTVYWDLGQ